MQTIHFGHFYKSFLAVKIPMWCVCILKTFLSNSLSLTGFCDFASLLDDIVKMKLEKNSVKWKIRNNSSNWIFYLLHKSSSSKILPKISWNQGICEICTKTFLKSRKLNFPNNWKMSYLTDFYIFVIFFDFTKFFLSCIGSASLQEESQKSLCFCYMYK